MDAERGDDLAETDQLQRDVRHGGKDAGEGKGHREGAAAVAAAGEVGQGYVTVTVTDIPEARQHEHHVGIEQDAVGDGEKAGGSGAVERGGDGDDGVSGVKIAADKEPGDQGSEAAPRQPPFFETVEVGALPVRGEESGNRDQQKTDAEYGDGDSVRVRGHSVRWELILSALLVSAGASEAGRRRAIRRRQHRGR